MGRSGALLREAKKKTKTYTFTAEQLEAHDKAQIEAYKERIRIRAEENLTKQHEEWKRNMDIAIQKEWDERAEKFGSTDLTENFLNTIQFLISFSCRILIEHFGWPAIPKKGGINPRNRTVRFAELIVKEPDKITEDENADIRLYARETYDLYGIRFTRDPEEEG